MRLFLYYVVHSVINTIRKVLKTWVAIFLVVVLFGFAVGMISSLVEKNSDPEEAGTTVSTVIGEDEDDDSEYAGDENEDPEYGEGVSKIKEMMDEYNISKAQIVDVVISAVFLLLFALDIVKADDTGKLFLPADVPMLFASPIKPQSVLMFRLFCTLGMYLFASLFMLFQLPNLVINAKFGMWGALSLVVVYALILVFNVLAKVVCYTIASRKENGINRLRPALAVVYGAIALGFVAFIMTTGKQPVEGVFAFFASPETHWVPFWGWLRAISYYAVNGETVKSLIYLAIFAVACIVLVLVIWRMKADFYEDAMFAAEHKAEQIEAVKKASKGAVATREKERNQSIERDGFHYGNGASVFFFKAVYNRFRFAKLKVLSVTMCIYICAAVLAGWFTETYTEADPFMVAAIVLGVMVFYRTFGDPIREDTTREFFILIPEKPIVKVLYSLLGCLAVTAIDLLIPMIIAAIMVGANPLVVALWFVFILSISFFGTTVGTFVSLSLPKDQAQTIATVVQMMFLYFGLTPSAIAVIAGVLLGHLHIAILIGAVLNIIIGFMVSLFIPLVLRRK